MAAEHLLGAEESISPMFKVIACIKSVCENYRSGNDSARPQISGKCQKWNGSGDPVTYHIGLTNDLFLSWSKWSSCFRIIPVTSFAFSFLFQDLRKDCLSIFLVSLAAHKVATFSVDKG